MEPDSVDISKPLRNIILGNMTRSKITEAAASIGHLGGKAGTGPAKVRPIGRCAESGANPLGEVSRQTSVHKRTLREQSK